MGSHGLVRNGSRPFSSASLNSYIQLPYCSFLFISTTVSIPPRNFVYHAMIAASRPFFSSCFGQPDCAGSRLLSALFAFDNFLLAQLTGRCSQRALPQSINHRTSSSVDIHPDIYIHAQINRHLKFFSYRSSIDMDLQLVPHA